MTLSAYIQGKVLFRKLLEMAQSLTRFGMKRIFDVSLILLSLPLLLPLLIAASTLVRLKLGAPVFFTQTRSGLHGRPFQMIKFRTMTNALDDHGMLLPDAERLTPFGRFMRSSSLDELPELWNVFKGNMSLVGPRPLLMEYLPLYSLEQSRRHKVRPGITGWAQVNGRNAISWDEKFILDVWYVDHQSFWLDLKILLLTVWNVLVRRGISADGHVSAPPFKGNKSEL